MKFDRPVRKIASLSLAFCLILGGLAALPLQLSAADAGEYLGMSGGLEYVSLGYSKAMVVGYEGQIRNISIPSKISFDDGEYDVTQIFEGVFRGVMSLTGVSLPDSLEYIGEEAFMGSGITAVTIPGTVSSIGEKAFAECKNLAGASIDFGVRRMGDAMFYDCPDLSNVFLADSIVIIGERTFANCVSLDNVNIPDSVEEIGPQAFKGCSSLTNLTLKEGLEEIAKEAFSASGLETLSIPNSVRLIGEGAFMSCGDLIGVTIGNGAVSIGDNAFAGCRRMTGVTIGSAVSDIGDEAFINTGLTVANLPASLHSVGRRAFFNTQLTAITIPASLTSIGGAAFGNNQGLATIKVDASNPAYKAVDNFLYTKSGDILLLAPSGITEASIPDTVRIIGEGAFAGNTDLASVAIGAGVREIEDQAFYGAGLSSVSIPDSVESIGDYAFAGCVQLTAASLGNGVKSIGPCAFMGTSIARADIPASVDSMGYQAFANCARLYAIYFWGSLPAVFGDLDEDIFLNCPTGLILFCPAGDTSWDNFSYSGVSQVARFGIGQGYSVAIEIQGSGSATASPFSAQSGAPVQLTATPNAGWYFYRWQVVSGAVTDLVIDRASTTFTMPGCDVTLRAVFISSQSESGSSSSGGGGGGGLATAPTPVFTAKQAENAAQKAAQAAKALGQDVAVVKLRNVGLVSKDAFAAIVREAGMPVRVQSDSMREGNRIVDVRMTLDPSKADTALDLSASTTSQHAAQVKTLFSKWFQNKMAVVDLTQQGSFGQPVEIAAKLDLTGMDMENLVIYAYDKASNKYLKLPDPAYWIDQYGYIHFTSSYAGTIIISNGVLAK